MVGTGEKETTDSKQMNSQSKQENQITFSSTQDLLRRLPFRCRRQAKQWLRTLHLELNRPLSKFLLLPSMTGLALGKSLNRSKLSDSTENRVITTKYIWFQGEFNETIISVSGIQETISKRFLLSLFIFNFPPLGHPMISHYTDKNIGQKRRGARYRSV